MSRSPLMGQLRRAYRVAVRANEANLDTETALELDLERRRLERVRARETFEASLSRRDLLRAGALGAAALAGLSKPARAGGGSHASLPRHPVAVVGAGLAGLTAAYRLERAGVPYRVFEASGRVGGRMRTLRGRFGQGGVELGGEFIDSGHAATRRLAREVGLGLTDLFAADRSPVHGALQTDLYFFGGRRVPEKEVVDAFRPLARRIEADLARLTVDTVGYATPGNGASLDNLSISAYLERAWAGEPLKSLLEVAYVGEYGLEADEQSSLNLLYLIGTEGPFSVFGESDERYQVTRGNDALPGRLAEIVGGKLVTSARLEDLRQRSDGTYRLGFARGARSFEVDASRVVLALPFTTLREVDVRVELPAVKRRAIRELGYGTNAKLIVGFSERVWRTRHRSNGAVYTDLPFAQTWESSRGQGVPVAALTGYLGGRRGLEIGRGETEARVAGWIEELERVYPGVRAARDGVSAARAHWPSEEFARGSYSAYRVGQWVALSGSEGEAVGGLHFAGEHTSLEAQGYMEGACESGERAAAEVLAALGVGRR